MIQRNLDLYTMIDQLRDYPTLDKGTIKRVTGVDLLLDSNNRTTNFYKGSGLKLNDATIETIEYRDAVPGGGGIGGALITFSLSTDSCKARNEVLRRYKPLKITDAPRGRSLSESTVYSRQEKWGTLSFGFTERTPDCLGSITLDVAPRIEQ